MSDQDDHIKQPIPELPQDWLEHVSVCTSQYDSTCRSLACELLRSRSRVRELEQALQEVREELTIISPLDSQRRLYLVRKLDAVLTVALHVTDKAARCRNCGRMRSDHVFGISGVPGCWNNSASTTFEPEVTDKAAQS